MGVSSPRIPPNRFFDVMVEQKVSLYPVAAFRRGTSSLETRPLIVVGELAHPLEEVLKLLPAEEFEDHFVGAPVVLDRSFLTHAMLSGKAKVRTFALSSDDRVIKLAHAWAISPNQRDPRMPQGNVILASFEEVLTSEKVNEILWKAGYFRPDNRIYPA